MDVLLISPEFYNPGPNFPWGILSVGSYLGNVKGCNVRLLDASKCSKSDFLDSVRNYCRKGKLVGISCMSPNSDFVKNTVDYIKGLNKDCKVIVGGPHAMLKPVQTCNYKNIDFVAHGEGELTLYSLLREIEAGGKRYNDISGLCYKDGEAVQKTPASAPAPFYDINYELLPAATKRFFPDYIQVLSGRGCSYRCTFCFNSVCGQKWRGRPALEMVSELEKIVERYNPKRIYFRDENFFHDKERINEFIRLYRQKGFSFKWHASFRASYYGSLYDLDYLKGLENINLEELRIGLESGSQRVLNYLKKGSNVEKMKVMVNDLGKLKNVKSIYSFLMGLPGETFDEYKQTFDLVAHVVRSDPRSRVLGPQYFRIYPGGELYEEIVSKYKFSAPECFESWAQRYASDKNKEGFGDGDINYPWMTRKQAAFAQNAYLLASLYRAPVDEKKKKRFSVIEWFLTSPFILSARLRVRYRCYGFMYDIKLYSMLRKIWFRLKHRKVSYGLE